MRHRSGILALAAAAAVACGRAPAPEPAAEHELTTRMLEVAPGLELSYVEIGDPRGEPVLFLHGYGDAGYSFHGTMRALSRVRPELRLIALDQRGHGASSMPDPVACAPAPERCFQPSQFASDAVAFMDRLGINAAHLVGHSMGSLVAQEIALAGPDRVRRLVLIGTAATTAGHPVLTDFLLAGLVEGPWREGLLRQGRSFPEDAYLSLPTEADTAAYSWLLANFVAEPLADPDTIARFARETARVRIGTWLGAARALASYDNEERLAALSVPTLVIWGSQDNLFQEPDQRRLRRALDQAVAACRMGYVWKQYGRKPLDPSGQPLDDFAHNPHWAAPEAVAADLAAFLRDGGAPTSDLFYGGAGAPSGIRTASGEAPIIARSPARCSPA